MGKKLYRSRRQRVIAGVCGGIAEYFDIDVTLIRLAWAAAVFIGGTGILLYILAAIIIPDEENGFYNGNADAGDEGFDRDYPSQPSSMSRNSVVMIIGLILIGIGGVSFFDRVLPFSLWHQIRTFFWPGIFVLVGVLIILSALKKH